MSDALNKQEVERVGELIHQYLNTAFKDGELEAFELKFFNRILVKMDHPTFDKVLNEIPTT